MPDGETFTVKAPCCGTPLDDATIDATGMKYQVGDVDDDGRADVVLVNSTTGAITVRRGNGDGSFSAPASWGSIGTAVDQIAVGDIDGDEQDDIAFRTAGGALGSRVSTGSTFAA